MPLACNFEGDADWAREETSTDTNELGGGRLLVDVGSSTLQVTDFATITGQRQALPQRRAGLDLHTLKIR